MASHDRTRLAHKAKYALAHPERVVPYARRLARDTWIGLHAKDHVSYYRAVMASDTAASHDRAVGSKSHATWPRSGKLQFDYLVKHGLQPSDRMLDIGCGNLRGGRLFVDYLDAGNYYGIDISPDILLAAQHTIEKFGIQAKLPHLTLVNDLTLGFLPTDGFDVVHAHSVFSHSPLDVVDQCFANVGRVLSTNGFFDFTFDRTEGVEHQVLREDFWYRSETLVNLATQHGLTATLMADWETLRHPQSKMRVTST